MINHNKWQILQLFAGEGSGGSAGRDSRGYLRWGTAPEAGPPERIRCPGRSPVLAVRDPGKEKNLGFPLRLRRSLCG